MKKMYLFVLYLEKQAFKLTSGSSLSTTVTNSQKASYYVAYFNLYYLIFHFIVKNSLFITSSCSSINIIPAIKFKLWQYPTYEEEEEDEEDEEEQEEQEQEEQEEEEEEEEE